MSSFINRFRRAGTSSKFGAKEDRNQKKRELPTYVEQDAETGEIDSSSKKKEDQAVDDKIDDAAGKEEEAQTKDVKATKPRTRKFVDSNVLKDREAGPSNKVGHAYSRLWKNYTTYSFSPIRFGNNSYFVPNGRLLQVILEQAIPLVARTNWIQKQEVGFNPYAAATGYFYLYYIQILRAKKAASDLVGQESSALTRFEKYNPFESIPIPDILVPFYESIVATQLSDTKYSWIVPTWGLTGPNDADWPNYAGFQHMTVDLPDHLRPNVPFMIANLATFGAMTNQQAQTHIDEDRIFTPASFDDGAQQPIRYQRLRFMNHTHDMTAAARNDAVSMTTALGASFPFQFWNENWREARRDIANSKFYVRNGINLAITVTNPTAAAGTNYIAYNNPGTTQPMVETVPMQKIDQYLFISKENNPVWFEYIREQMTIFAKHFPNGCKTLADIATTGGMESTIVCHQKFELPITNNGTDYVYPSATCGRFNSTASYYPRLFSDITGSFATTRNDVSENERLQALAVCINANPAIAIGTSIIRQGKFFSQNLTTDTVVQQSIGDMAETTPGAVPLYTDINDYVRDVLVVKPE
jgi:hypothetical protein